MARREAGFEETEYAVAVEAAQGAPSVGREQPAKECDFDAVQSAISYNSCAYAQNPAKSKVGYPLNRKKLSTYNEKLQWVEFHIHSFFMLNRYDKRVVQKCAESKGCEKRPNGPRWQAFDLVDVAYSGLNACYAVKATRGLAFYGIIYDAEFIGRAEVVAKCLKWPKGRLLSCCGERFYGMKVSCVNEEKDLEDYGGSVSFNRKILSFGCELRAAFVNIGCDKDRYVNVDNTESSLFRGIKIGYPSSGFCTVEKTKALVEILKIARRLSRYFRHVGVDPYCAHDRGCAAELVFAKDAGFGGVELTRFTREMSNWFRSPCDEAA